MAIDRLITVVATGARRRRTYSITRAGQAELQRWLLHPPARFVARSEFVLRLFSCCRPSTPPMPEPSLVPSPTTVPSSSSGCERPWRVRHYRAPVPRGRSNDSPPSSVCGRSRRCTRGRSGRCASSRVRAELRPVERMVTALDLLLGEPAFPRQGHSPGCPGTGPHRRQETPPKASAWRSVDHQCGVCRVSLRVPSTSAP